MRAVLKKFRNETLKKLKVFSGMEEIFNERPHVMGSAIVVHMHAESFGTFSAESTEKKI